MQINNLKWIKNVLLWDVSAVLNSISCNFRAQHANHRSSGNWATIFNIPEEARVVDGSHPKSEFFQRIYVESVLFNS